MVMCSLVGGGPRWASGGELVLMRPETFLRQPSSWLRACSEFHSTITASPNFGLELVARRGNAPNMDLRRLRVCLTGGEIVHPETLQAFESCFGDSNLNPLVLCPAYGLAEAAVAVSVVAPEEHWSADAVDQESATTRDRSVRRLERSS